MLILSFILALVFAMTMYRTTRPELSFSKKAILFILRTITVWIALSFLLIPLYRVTTKTWEKPKALVLIDNSDSMELDYLEKTKTLVSTDFLEKIKTDLQEYFALEYAYFSSTLEGKPESSDLIKTISQIYTQKGKDLDEIFLFSDGYFINDKFEKLRNYPFKINTFSFSDTKRDNTPKINNVRSNRETFLEENTPLEISVNSYGITDLVIEIKNRQKVLLKKNIDKNNSDLIRTNLQLQFDRTGLYDLTINLKDDKQIYDSVKHIVKVNDNQKRIVFLTDSPNWDGKYIKDALKIDQRFLYDYFRVDEKRIYKGSEQVNFNEYTQKLDLFILDNRQKLEFDDDQLEIIKNRVKQGVSLFVIGDIIKGLEEYYPVKRSNISRKYTGLVVAGPAINNYSTFKNFFKVSHNLPPVEYKYYTKKKSSLDIALIDNLDSSPAITLISRNQAKILHFTFENFWRYATRGNNTYFQDFILNIIRWLSMEAGEKFLVNSDKDGYYYGEDVIISASMLDEKGDYIIDKNLKIEVIKGDSVAVTDYLLWERDLYKYTIEDLTAGHYQYKVTDQDTKHMKYENFIIYDMSLEKYHRGFNNVALQEISSITKGNNYQANDPIKIIKNLKRPKKEINIYNEFKIIYNNFLLFIIILSFSLELFFRRRWGLV